MLLAVRKCSSTTELVETRVKLRTADRYIVQIQRGCYSRATDGAAGGYR
jgi:hypothetical protein